MIAILRWVWALTLAFVALVGAGMLINMLPGQPQPLWTLPLIGLLSLLVGLALRHAEKRGWIRGVGLNRPDLAKRRQRLADDRDRIIAEAQRKT